MTDPNCTTITFHQSDVWVAFGIYLLLTFLSPLVAGVATAIRRAIWPDQNPDREGNDRRWETLP